MAFEENVSSAEKGGGQLSSDRGWMFPNASLFPVTKWLFCIAEGSRNAAVPSSGSHLPSSNHNNSSKDENILIIPQAHSLKC